MIPGRLDTVHVAGTRPAARKTAAPLHWSADGPDMAEGISELAMAHAPAPVVERHDNLRAGLDRQLPGGIAVRYIEMDDAACAAEPRRCRGTAVIPGFGKLVMQKRLRRPRVSDARASASCHPRQGACHRVARQSPFVECDRRRALVDRRDGELALRCS